MEFSPYVIILVILFMIWYLFSYRKINLFNRGKSAEEKIYWGILCQVTSKPKTLKVSQVNDILELADKEGCLPQFRAWLLKQDITDGVRTQVNLVYSLINQRLDRRK